MADVPGRAFRRAFARREVVAMTDRRSFERGVLYAAEGRVIKRTMTASNVKAKVRGTSTYQVRLSLDDDDEPAYDCTCPVGQDGRFCKHAVAVALVVSETVPDPGQETEQAIDVRDYLEGLDHQALVDLLVERAAEDDLFDARLRMDAARTTAGPPHLGAFRHAIDEVFMVGDHVDYRGMFNYASNVNTVLDSLQDLLNDGHPDAVVTLAEHAIDRAEDAVGYVDDSDGWMAGIAERLQELHLAACAQADLDPVELAGTLFDRERESGDLEFFYAAASAYADVLGTEGLAEYQRLAQEEWDALPPLGPKDEERTWSSRRFRITQIMRTLAELSGDVDAVVEVLARDQSSAYQFVRIAEVLREANRYDDALVWAQQGLALHGVADSRLVAVVAEELHRTGRGEDAVRVAWDAYAEAPGLRTYRPLAENAQRADLWPAWHDKALELLRSNIAQVQRQRAPRRVTHWAAPGPDSSTLVEVLLFDEDVDGAWAEASAAGCRRDLWQELARRREAEHPLEAIPIWQAKVERLIGLKKNQAYADAVALISHVGRLMTAAERSADFAPYAAQLRITHKPKRNLMKLFDAQGWVW